MSEIRAKIGFVGAGGHANYRLYPAAKLVREIDLVALCDMNRERADGTAKRWGVPHVYYDLDKMLESEKLDAAIIAGPPQMHCEVGARCLEAGLHIYVEKPSAVSSEEAEKLADIAVKHKRKGICGFMKRYSPAYRAGKAITETPQFGGVHMAEIRFSQGPYPKLWGIEENMRAFLIGQLVHMFDITRFMCGDVDKVHARLHQVSEDAGTYAVTLQFASGAVGLMSLNALESDTWHFNEVFHVTGNREWLEVEDQLYVKYHPLTGWLPEPLRGERVLKNQVMEFRPSLVLEYETLELGGYTGELRDLAVCAVTDKQPVATLQDSTEALRIAEAIWKSATTGAEAEVKPSSQKKSRGKRHD